MYRRRHHHNTSLTTRGANQRIFLRHLRHSQLRLRVRLLLVRHFTVALLAATKNRLLLNSSLRRLL